MLLRRRGSLRGNRYPIALTMNGNSGVVGIRRETVGVDNVLAAGLSGSRHHGSTKQSDVGVSTFRGTNIEQ